MEDVGEKHVVQVVTDNAIVITLLKAKRSNMFWNGGAAHCIGMMLEDIGKLPSIDSTIAKARVVIVFFLNHTQGFWT
jgi:hypothetical protein